MKANYATSYIPRNWRAIKILSSSDTLVGEGVMPEWKTPFQEIPIGKGRKIKDGEGDSDPQPRPSR